MLWRDLRSRHLEQRDKMVVIAGLSTNSQYRPALNERCLRRKKKRYRALAPLRLALLLHLPPRCSLPLFTLKTIWDLAGALLALTLTN